MRKSINDYSLYVFDLDGTLYDQPRLRMIMATRLATYYMLHPFRIKELILLQHFRKVKDAWTKNSSEEEMMEKVAADKGSDIDTVRGIVKRWIYDNPLSALSQTKDDKLIGWMGKLRSDGKKVVVLSDYPTKDKLAALGVEVDKEYSPEDPRIDELKPSSKGLKIVLSDQNVGCEDALMIGDRDEKDGECARGCGMDCLILPRKVSKRNLNGI